VTPLLERRRAARALRRSRCALLAALLPACASTSAAPAFRDTAQLVEARSGRRIFWNQGGAADGAVARRVHDLLARDMSIETAIQIALINNKDLQAIYEDLSIAQADLVQAGLLQNPTISGGLALPVASQGVETGYDVGVVQDFLGLFMLGARKKIAATELEATKLRVGNAVLQVTYDVQVAYDSLVAAQQVLDVRRTALEAGDTAMALAEAQHLAGNTSDLDLVNQRTRTEQLRTETQRSEADALVAREALTRLLGLWGADAGFHVPSKLPDPPAADVPLEHLEALAIERRLDLASARAERQALSHAAAMARSFRFTSSVNAGAGFERAPEHYSAITPRASLELPIFDQHQAAIARLDAQVRQAQAREAALAVDVRSEVRAAHGRLAALRELVARYTGVVLPLRTQVVELSQEEYNAMLIGAPQILLAKQDQVNAEREAVEALRDYWIAHADLERAVGAVFPANAAVPPAPTP
jgi:cobalt-zinc-cadmium efflux system outer membrane protein